MPGERAHSAPDTAAPSLVACSCIRTNGCKESGRGWPGHSNCVMAFQHGVGVWAVWLQGKQGRGKWPGLFTPSLHRHAGWLKKLGSAGVVVVWLQGKAGDGLGYAPPPSTVMRDGLKSLGLPVSWLCGCRERQGMAWATHPLPPPTCWTISAGRKMPSQSSTHTLGRGPPSSGVLRVQKPSLPLTRSLGSGLPSSSVWAV
eukprot:1144141-Pelagomonas_calceolata.AAC.1